MGDLRGVYDFRVDYGGFKGGCTGFRVDYGGLAKFKAT